MSETHEIPDYMMLDDATVDVDEEAEYFASSANCFLCDHTFADGETPFLMFEQRLGDGGQVSGSSAEILSSALGKVLTISMPQSTLLCHDCNDLAQEYEDLEKQFSMTRYRIISTYNRTARRNNLKPIAFEIDGVLQDVKGDALETATAEEEFIKDVNTTKLSEEKSAVEAKPANEIVVQDPLYLMPDLSGSFNEDDLVEVVSEAEEEGLLDVEDPSKYAFSMVQTPQTSVSDTVPEFVLEQDELSAASSQISGKNDGNVAVKPTETEYKQQEESMSNQFHKIDDSDSSVDSSSDQVADMFSVLTSDIAEDSELALEKRPLYLEADGGFVCLMCPVDDAQEELRFDIKSFAEHMLKEHNKTFHICPLCNVVGFLKRRELNKHLNVTHYMTKDKDGVQCFECDICDSGFINQRLLRLHKQLHKNTHKPYECKQCCKQYSSRNLLEEHMNMHTGARPHKCHICPKDFASKYTLQSHIKIHTERQRPFQCDECDKSFLKQQNLTQHKKLHSNEKPFACEQCDKCFATAHNLQVHTIVHSNYRPFICRTCGKAFARRAEIRDHERTHTKEKPFACDICDKSFAQRSNLMTHKKATHLNEKQHKCEYCDRSFKRRRLMLYHVNAVHTGVRPFKCNVCDAAFVYPDHHKKHMLIHATKKQFACEVCGKEFHSRDNRNAHRFVHSDKKPYECMECGAGFMRKPSLLTHMAQTKHVNDTIIVNQPQITRQDGVATATTSSIYGVDTDYGDYIDEDAAIEVITGDTALETLDIIAAQVKDEVAARAKDDDGQEDDNAIASVSGQLIKDQIGNVKYIQFEGIDNDGQQTLTWVDIGDDKV